MTDYSKMSEHPRPEYLAKLKRKPEKKLKDRLNTVTGVYEKTVSFWTVKVPSYFLSYSIIGLYVSIFELITGLFLFYNLIFLDTFGFSCSFCIDHLSNVLFSLENNYLRRELRLSSHGCTARYNRNY